MRTVVIFGAGGQAGRLILAEARQRGHRVVAAVRDPAQHADLAEDEVFLMQAEATDPDQVRDAAAGCDVAVSTAPSGGDLAPDHLVRINAALFDGLSRAHVQRLLMVGGAGTLFTTSGKQLLDDPEFPTKTRPRARAHQQALHVLHTHTMALEWVYLTPPPGFLPAGERTGRYRLHRRQPEIDDLWALPALSYADYAVGVVDEIDTVRHRNESVLLTGGPV